MPCSVIKLNIIWRCSNKIGNLRSRITVNSLHITNDSIVGPRMKYSRACESWWVIIYVQNGDISLCRHSVFSIGYKNLSFSIMNSLWKNNFTRNKKTLVDLASNVSSLLVTRVLPRIENGIRSLSPPISYLRLVLSQSNASSWRN